MDAYATPAQLATWLGAANPPEDAERLLLRASETIEPKVLSGYAADRDGNPTDADEHAWLADAACAQVEFWLLVSEQHGIAGVTTGTLNAGGVSHNMPGSIAPRALDVLERAGMRTTARAGRPYMRPLDLIGRTYTRVDGVTIEQTTAGP